MKKILRYSRNCINIWRLDMFWNEKLIIDEIKRNLKILQTNKNENTPF